MYIKFESIEIENFQSIGRALIELSERGTVLIKGINNYEDKAKSNGSGKSSCMEAIYYAIYGRTSAGVTNPKNRYSNDGCMVKLIFSVDNISYTVIRSVSHSKYKTGIILMKGDTDISGRNKTDTDKMIKSDIFPISSDIFLSSIFLSQGFSNRLSNLSPTSRKERIEVLTDTSSRVEAFKSNLSSLKSKLSNEYNELSQSASYHSGMLISLSEQIDELEKEIAKSKNSKPDGDPNEIKSRLDKLRILIDSVNSEISKYNTEIQSMRNKISSNNLSSRELSERQSKLEKERLSIANRSSSICPTCGQVIGDESKKKELIEHYDKKIASLIEDEDRLINSNHDINGQIENTRKILDMLTSKKSKLNSMYIDLDDKYREILSYRDTSEDEEKIKSLKAKMVDTSKIMTEKSDESKKVELLRDVTSHCILLVTKQFRGYIMKNTIDFINSRLKKYSDMLFSNSNDTIQLVVDASKLDIYLGDALYDTLSGGEKRKVDLAIVLAQRDLALNIAGFSCNMLVMDEIYDGLDDSAISIVSDMFTEASSEIDSMFVISHKPDSEIPYDSIITVTKNEDRISVVNNY